MDSIQPKGSDMPTLWRSIMSITIKVEFTSDLIESERIRILVCQISRASQADDYNPLRLKIITEQAKI